MTSPTSLPVDDDRWRAFIGLVTVMYTLLALVFLAGLVVGGPP